jgi:hypothetical protein
MKALGTRRATKLHNVTHVYEFMAVTTYPTYHKHTFTPNSAEINMGITSIPNVEWSMHHFSEPYAHDLQTMDDQRLVLTITLQDSNTITGMSEGCGSNSIPNKY